MDSARFDALTRSLSSRRSALARVVGGLAALLRLGVPDETAAHNPAPTCRKIRNLKQRRRCRRRAQAHARKHRRQRQRQRDANRCQPESEATTCAGRCGARRNNCNQAIACPACGPGKFCLDNGSCAQICPDPDTGSCAVGCFCNALSLDQIPVCLAAVGSCDEVPMECTSTAQCPVGFDCQDTGCTDKPLSTRCRPLCAA